MIATTNSIHKFPDTKYMGSKQRLLPFIEQHVRDLKFNSCLDAFCGTSCVAHMMKRMGKTVITNDLMEFCFHIARATIENARAILDEEDLAKILRQPSNSESFIETHFAGLYYSPSESRFLDKATANIRLMRNRYKQSLALAALCRACMKKRPRGLFTFTGRKGWDGRRDLAMSMKDQFLRAVAELNAAVFDNGQSNRALNSDVFDIPDDIAELVYIDTPYISPYSDCDYTRRYHFVEGLCSYWRDVEIMWNTRTRKIRSYPTAFSTKSTAEASFHRLFQHFRKSILVVSYSSNCIPDKERMIEILSEYKSRVTVYEMAHRYHNGNHAHKVGLNNTRAIEYLFVAQ